MANSFYNKGGVYLRNKLIIFLKERKRELQFIAHMINMVTNIIVINNR